MTKDQEVFLLMVCDLESWQMVNVVRALPNFPVAANLFESS